MAGTSLMCTSERLLRGCPSCRDPLQCHCMKWAAADTVAAMRLQWSARNWARGRAGYGRGGRMDPDAPTQRIKIMGILNVTPDSFFDGGRYATTRGAVDHG